MKRIFASLIVVLACSSAFSQNDGKGFKGYIYNDEYQIFIKMNLYDKDIKVPGQDFLGSLDGYIGCKRSGQVWPIISSRITQDKVAEIEAVNDYGSEDFTAKITVNKDGTYTLRKSEGSTLKFPVKGKWHKIPGTVILKKQP